MASLAPTRIIGPLQTNRIHAKPRIRTIMKNTNNLKLGPAFLPGYHRQPRRELVVRGVRVRHGENGIAMTFEYEPASPNWTPDTIGSVPERLRNSPGLVNHAVAWYVPQLHT